MKSTKPVLILAIALGIAAILAAQHFLHLRHGYTGRAGFAVLIGFLALRAVLGGRRH